LFVGVPHADTMDAHRAAASFTITKKILIASGNHYDSA
jgi:hypothetical protein